MTTTTRWQEDGERGGLNVHKSRTGWVVESWSIVTGDRSGWRVLVPWALAEYGSDVDLHSDHNDYVSVGRYIAAVAISGLGRVLRRGHIVR